MSLSEIHALARAGRLREAHDRIAALTAQLPRPEHPYRDRGVSLDEAELHHEHGTLAWINAEFGPAGDALDRAHQLRRDAVGDEHPLTLATLARQAALAGYRGRHADARRLFEQAIAGLDAALGADAAETAIARRNFAADLRDAGDLDAARTTLDAAAPVIERRCGRDHPAHAATLKVDALLSLYEGVSWRGLRQAGRAIDACGRCHGEAHPFTAAARLIAGRAELALGRTDEAAAHVERSITDLELAYGDHPLVALALSCASRIDRVTGAHLDRAEARLRRALALYARTYDGQPLVAMSTGLHAILRTTSRWAEAAALAELNARRLPDDPPLRVQWLAAAIVDYRRAGLTDTARDRLAEAIAVTADPTSRAVLEELVERVAPPPPPAAPTASP